jgi:outer membrane protein TolC
MWLSLVSYVATSLSLPQALSLVRERSPEMVAAQAKVSASEAKEKAARGALLPRLRIEGGVQVWNKPLDINFVDPTQLGDTSTLPPQLAGLLNGLAQPFRARDQVTGTFGVTLAQPIVGLYPLWQLRKLEGQEQQALRHRVKTVDQDLALRVVEAYAQAMTARSALKIAEKGLELAERFEARATALADSGIIARTEVLKAKASVASSREKLIYTRTGVELSRAALSILLKTEVVGELDDLPVRTLALDLEQARTEMRAQRAELFEVEQRIDQAETGVALARSRLLPEVNLVANYTYTGGNRFAAQNQLFVGAMLSWDIFEWGNKWFQIDAAEAVVGEAKANQERLKDGLDLQLRQAMTKVLVAEQSVAAATASLEAAQEVMKSEESRFASGQVTATELNLAQTMYLQAETQLATVRYQAVVAQASVESTIGRDLTDPR